MSSINFNNKDNRINFILWITIVFLITIVLFIALNGCNFNENTPVNSGVFLT